MMVLRILVPVSAFLLAAIAWLPLRVVYAAVPHQTDVTIGNLSGTIWQGTVTELSWRGTQLGSFQVSVAPLDLLAGTPRLSLVGGAGPLSSADLIIKERGVEIQRANLTVALSEFAPGIPAGPTVRVNAANLDWDGATCRSASGRITIDDIPSIGAPALGGDLGCESGVMMTRLRSADGRQDIAIAIENVGPASSGDFRTAIRTASPEAALLLSGLGLMPRSEP